MKNFNWRDFKEGKIAVHCDRREKALDFLEKCEEQGINWSTGDKASTLSYWHYNQRDTTYYIFESNELGWGNVNHFKRIIKIKTVKWKIN